MQNYEHDERTQNFTFTSQHYVDYCTRWIQMGTYGRIYYYQITSPNDTLEFQFSARWLGGSGPLLHLHAYTLWSCQWPGLSAEKENNTNFILASWSHLSSPSHPTTPLSILINLANLAMSFIKM